jgi:hypothetical protein
LAPGWSNSWAYGVNDSGLVTGGVYNIAPTVQVNAFIGTAAGVTLLPLPAGWSGSSGVGINDSGQVTGSVYMGVANTLNQQAFIGTVTGSALIPLPAGWSNSYGFAVNASGQVAGDGRVGPYPANYQAFVGTAAGVTVIPLLTGATYNSVGYASINNLGFVVGASDAGGWIWDAVDGTVLLNNLLPVGWNVSNAVSINNNGVILANASFDGGPAQYVELSPIATPEPGTLALVLISLICCWIGSRVKRAA